MAFHVGQKVECVDDTPHPRGALAWTYKNTVLKKGTVYTIRGTETGGGVLGIYLYEVKSDAPPFPDGRERSFCHTRFRPIVERKTDTGIEILKKITADASKKRERVASGHD